METFGRSAQRDKDFEAQMEGVVAKQGLREPLVVELSTIRGDDWQPACPSCKVLGRPQHKFQAQLGEEPREWNTGRDPEEAIAGLRRTAPERFEGREMYVVYIGIVP
jgi:hypothetical protein